MVYLPTFTLPKTNIAPENGWLEYEISYWEGLFPGDMLVSGSVVDFYGKCIGKYTSPMDPMGFSPGFSRAGLPWFPKKKVMGNKMP